MAPDFDDVPNTSAARAVRDAMSAMSRRVLLGAIGLAATGIVSAAGVGFQSHVEAAERAAHAEEIHRTLQRDVTTLSGDLEEHEDIDGHPGLSEDIATLRTKIDALQSDVNRIERLLDERLPRRGRR